MTINAPPAPHYALNDTGSVNGATYQAPHGKSSAYNGADSKKNPVSSANQVSSYGSYRVGQVSTSRGSGSNTHNLPIASVSSYHSNRGRATSTQRPRGQPMSGSNPAVAVSSASAMIVMPPRVPEYSLGPSTVNHAAVPSNERIGTGARYVSQHGYSTYATTIAPSHHGSSSSSSTTVTSIGSATRPSASTGVTVHSCPSSDPAGRSGSYTAQRPSESGYAYKKYSYGGLASGPAQPNQSRAMTTIPPPTQPSPQTNGAPIRKRESPLDLSVKTVKTPADSTARDDLDGCAIDKHVSSTNTSCPRSNGVRDMLPPGQPASSGSHMTYDPRNPANGSRNPASSCLRASTPQTVCAPKVDFLPDFNSAPLRNHHPGPPSHPENALRRGSSRQIYEPPQQNANALPHMATFKKNSLPTTSVYDGKSPSTSYPAAINDSPTAPRPSSMRYASVIDPTRTASAALPLQEYPPDPSKYYNDGKNKFPQTPLTRERPGAKRPAEPPYPDSVSGPAKQPRLDPWRLAIDKQIQQKLSTAKALHEQQKRQEMSLPVPLPNGTLISPGTYERRADNPCPTEPNRYQAYCDKRSYPESMIPVSSASYSHPVPKSSGVHPASQPSGSQISYSGYRQNQRSSYPSQLAVQPTEQPSNTGADKRVLSLLRNSLENKQQREEQLNSQQPILVNHSQQSFQNKVRIEIWEIKGVLL